MDSNVKINGVNMFINKLDATSEIINLDTLKEKFNLDEGENGFYRLSLYKKIVYGSNTITDNYNRPAIGPIENGLYCSYCERIGNSSHKMDCESPQDESLYLTLGGFERYIMKNPSYNGDYLQIKNAFINKEVTKEILEQLLNIDDEIPIKDGAIDITKYKNLTTKIAYYGINKKRGPVKLASKTTTSQLLNSLIIFHEIDGHKTSIRVTKYGLINLININTNPVKQKQLIDELINRINLSGSVNESNLKDITGSTVYKKIPEYSYIHSAAGQFFINKIVKGINQINFKELDDYISPYDNRGKLIKNPRNTTITRAKDGSPIILFDGLKIIEWEYFLPRISRNEVRSKEYIKLTIVPKDGLKLTAVINKFGSVMLNISKCSSKQINTGLCGTGTSDITVDLFDEIEIVLNRLFDNNSDILIMKSLSGTENTSPNYNTISGKAPSGEICRLTRTRYTADGREYREGMRPDPYSWKGSCPDPNYQYLKPGGVQDKDGLWYPCCDTKTKDSVQMMKNYLKTGFPTNRIEMAKYNIKDNIDGGTGIIIPNSNSQGSPARVKINGKYENVIVGKRGKKKNNEYTVKTGDGKNVIVKGTDFEKDSRIFPGLNSFDRESLLECIIQNLKNTNTVISKEGKIIKNTISVMNEKPNKENRDLFLSLIQKKTSLPFTYYTIPLLTKDEVFNVRKINSNAVKFYLVLSPGNNFYINDDLLSLDSNISNDFKDVIILDGYLSYSEEEQLRKYEIIDILYYKNKINTTFDDRYMLMHRIMASVLYSITDELLQIPDSINNVILGSYRIIQTKPDDKMVFMSNEKTIVYEETDNYEDIIPLQILNKNKTIIEFGYDSKTLPKNMGLDFLSTYAFKIRDIPSDLKLGDYYNISINRDSKGFVVPNRVINIVNKVNNTRNMKKYDEIINILLIKFNPINSDYFNSSLDWEYSEGILEYDGNTLVKTN